jgi:hypothetical protein
MDRLIKKAEKIDLSGDDILSITNNQTTIHAYSDLDQIDNMEQLFGGKPTVTLLYQTTQNSGHWVCLIKKSESELYFFDPYGLKPDSELQYASYNLRIHNNVQTPHLTALISKSNYTIDYNKVRLQKFFKDVNTCGRWVAIRILWREMSDDHFNHLFLNQKEPSDYYASALTITHSF